MEKLFIFAPISKHEFIERSEARNFRKGKLSAGKEKVKRMSTVEKPKVMMTLKCKGRN